MRLAKKKRQHNTQKPRMRYYFYLAVSEIEITKPKMHPKGYYVRSKKSQIQNFGCTHEDVSSMKILFLFALFSILFSSSISRDIDRHPETWGIYYWTFTAPDYWPDADAQFPLTNTQVSDMIYKHLQIKDEVKDLVKHLGNSCVGARHE